MKKSEKCPTPGPVMMGINQETKKGRIWRPPCRRWTCPVCRDKRAQEWGFVALVGAVELQERGCRLIFVTVTSHEKLNAAQTLAAWPSAWKKLRQRIIRKHGPGDYYMVTERHRSGRLHVHAVVTWDIENRWLKDNARACGLGYMADTQAIDAAGIVVSYVSKYLTKFADVWPKGWRRVRMSNSWPKLTEPSTENGWRDWMLGSPSKSEVQDHVHDYASAGYEVNIADGLLDSLTLKS